MRGNFEHPLLTNTGLKLTPLGSCHVHNHHHFFSETTHEVFLLMNPSSLSYGSCFEVLDVLRRDVLVRFHLLNHSHVASRACCPVTAKRTRTHRGLYPTLRTDAMMGEMRPIVGP